MSKIKMKTHKSMAKRVSITKTGKIKYTRSNRRHQVHLKDKKRMRHLRKDAYLNETNAEAVRKMLPYS